MVVVEDLECIITKLMRFAKVQGQVQASMEVLLIDWSNQSLGAQDTRIVSVQLIPNPSACLNSVFCLIGNSD